MSLGQLATEEKSNEITAIPELIENINVQGAVVTIDAAGCQKNIAKQIIDSRGYFVPALKGNQGNLHKQVISWVDEQFDNDWDGIVREELETRDNTHGREDIHSYIQFMVPEDLKGKRKLGWFEDHRNRDAQQHSQWKRES
jgi:predicted transposase YbfD/YdcC